MRNLLEETTEFLKENGKTPEDVQWVGSHRFWFTWAEFSDVASVEYDPDFGAPKVAVDLMVVGHGWWLSRGEYDGSEWWDYNEQVPRPDYRMTPNRVVVNEDQFEVGWMTLLGMAMADTGSGDDEFNIDRAKDWLNANAITTGE